MCPSSYIGKASIRLFVAWHHFWTPLVNVMEKGEVGIRLPISCTDNGRVTRDNMIARILDVNYLFLFHEGSKREHTIKAVLKLVWRESASCNRILTIGPKFKEIMSRLCEAGCGN